jgi:acetyl esterase/lipase
MLVLGMVLAGLAALAADAATQEKKKDPQEKKQAKPFVAPEGVELQRDIEYGTGNSRPLRLHLMTPKEASKTPRPVVVWIHGGGWQGGHRDSGLPRLAPLVQHGYVGVSIEYRLSAESQFPAQLEDCRTAIRYLRQNAKALNIDPNRIGVWGSSAGGHLVALLGTIGQHEKVPDKGPYKGISARVQAVCDFCGPTDLAKLSANAKPGNPIEKLLGGPASAKQKLATLANPITHVNKDAPPFLIVHGDMDKTVPMEQSELLEAALKKAGVPVTLYVAKGQGHGLGGPEVQKAVMEFFDRTLKTQK